MKPLAGLVLPHQEFALPIIKWLQGKSNAEKKFFFLATSIDLRQASRY
jgi:hypothetical protein